MLIYSNPFCPHPFGVRQTVDKKLFSPPKGGE